MIYWRYLVCWTFIDGSDVWPKQIYRQSRWYCHFILHCCCCIIYVIYDTGDAILILALLFVLYCDVVVIDGKYTYICYFVAAVLPIRYGRLCCCCCICHDEWWEAFVDVVCVSIHSGDIVHCFIGDSRGMTTKSHYSFRSDGSTIHSDIPMTEVFGIWYLLFLHCVFWYSDTCWRLWCTNIDIVFCSLYCTMMGYMWWHK